MDKHTQRRHELEVITGEIGKTLFNGLPPDMAFVFILADFKDAGNMAYVSNVERVTSIAMLREMADKMEQGEVSRGPL